MPEPTINLPPELPAAQPLVPPAATNNVFRGPNGIRAGWRALIFLAFVASLLAAVNLVVALVMHFVLHRPVRMGALASLTPATAILSDGSIFVFTASPR
jgi:hypothetical protein